MRQVDDESQAKDGRVESLVRRCDLVFSLHGFENFVVFNAGPLSFEPISDADIKTIQVRPGSGCASKAWSCNATWFFVIRRHDIILINVYTNEGFLCRKKSAMFIQAFLDAPEPQRRKRAKRPSAV